MNKKTTAHCNTCLGDRNHEILFTEETRWSDDDCALCGGDKYEMLKCGGCDGVILRRTSWFSEDPERTVRFYPPAAFRQEPRWVHSLRGKNPRFVRDLLREIYIGVQNDMKITATMGVRALMERVMIDCVRDQGTFAKNITEFTRQGFVSEKQRVILEAVLEAGHATIHRSYQPSGNDLETCVDIAEGVLQTVYVHPDKADELKRRVPTRRKPKRA